MDVSLYELVQSAEPQPQSLRISPATLLLMVGSVIDLLVEQQMSATLWVKLPPGQIWQAEIQRFHQQVKVPHAIYTCNLYPNTPEAGLNGFTTSLPGLGGVENRPESLVVPVRLAPTDHHRRDYFLLVLSSQFCCLILAHRPRTRLQTESGHKTKGLLSAICSFEQLVIQRVLDGIKQAIVLQKLNRVGSKDTQTTPAKENSASTDLLANWDSLFRVSPEADPALISQLLAKQTQRQDEILRRSTRDRAVAVQLKNTELLNILRLKDELLSNACQELRTPLTHMKTALSLLSSPQLKPTQRQRYLNMLNTECDRQNSLISGLLDLVQLDSMAEQTILVPVRLSDIVPGVVSTYQPLAQEKGIMLAYTVPTEIPPVSCLSHWLKQIVINLLHNSIKFTPTGGQVWVRSTLQGDCVHLEFRDTGVGIPPGEIPKIFDRFYRVRPVAGEDADGAGLGLTIVQQILLRCGGSISVKSRLGEGSVFNVILPVADSTQ